MFARGYRLHYGMSKSEMKGRKPSHLWSQKEYWPGHQKTNGTMALRLFGQSGNSLRYLRSFPLAQMPICPAETARKMTEEGVPVRKTKASQDRASNLFRRGGWSVSARGQDGRKGGDGPVVGARDQVEALHRDHMSGSEKRSKTWWGGRT